MAEGYVGKPQTDSPNRTVLNRQLDEVNDWIHRIISKTELLQEKLQPVLQPGPTGDDSNARPKSVMSPYAMRLEEFTMMLAEIERKLGVLYDSLEV